MASALFKVFTRKQQNAPERKKNTVTGVHDRSEVESMIQRYLELAHSALKQDSGSEIAESEEELSA